MPRGRDMEHARARVLPSDAGGRIFPPENESPANDAPLLLVKCYAYAKWVLERVESFPKSQRFILGYSGSRTTSWTCWRRW